MHQDPDPVTGEVRTARLLLRPPRLADAGPVAQYAGDFEVARMTARIPYPYGIADAEAWLLSAMTDGGGFVIERDGGLIGCCGTAWVDKEAMELGYWIARPFWGHGYATEAVKTLVDVTFRTKRCRCLVASRFADNPASGRVLEKVGFVATGTAEHWCAARRDTVDAVTYALRRPTLAARARRWFGELAP